MPFVCPTLHECRGEGGLRRGTHQEEAPAWSNGGLHQNRQGQKTFDEVSLDPCQSGFTH